MYKQIQYFLIFAILTIVSCEVNDCDSERDSLVCVEKKLINYVDKIEDETEMGGYVVLEKIKEKSGRKMKDKEDIIDRCLRFLREHQITIKMPGDEAREFEPEGRSKRIRRLLLPLLLLLKVKFGIILPLILGIIGLVAFKGMGAGLVALAISAAVGLKSLLEHNHSHSKISYEIIPQIAAPWSRTGLEGTLPVSTVTNPAYQTIV